MAGSISAFSAAVQAAGWQAERKVRESTAGAAAQSGPAQSGAGGLPSALPANAAPAGISGVSYFPPRVSGGKADAQANYFPPKAEDGTKKTEPDATHVTFGQDKDTGLSVIRFVDGSGRVVKQIPPEQLLDSISELWKTAGILVNKSV